MSLLASPLVSNMMRQRAREKTECIHACRVDPFLSQAAEKSPLNAFSAGSDAVNDGLRISSYHFVLHILTAMAATGGLDKIFDCNIEHWAQCFTFMNAFLQRALPSSQLARPVAKFIERNVKENTQTIEQDAQLMGSPFPFTNSLSSLSNSSVEDKHCKHKREKSIEADHPRYYAKTRGDRRKRNKSSSFSSSFMSIHTSPTSLDQESVQSKLSKLNSEYKAQKAKLRDVTIPVLKTTKKHYMAAIAYRTYRLASLSPRYDNTVSSHVAKLFKKVKSQMKAHFFDPKDRSPSLDFWQHLSSHVIQITLTKKQLCVLHPTMKRKR